MTAAYAIGSQPGTLTTGQVAGADHNAGSVVVAAPPKKPFLERIKPAWVDTFKASAHREGMSNVGGVLGKTAALVAPPLALGGASLLIDLKAHQTDGATVLASIAGVLTSAYGAYRWDTYRKIGDKHPTCSAMRDTAVYVVVPAVVTALVADIWLNGVASMFLGAGMGLVGVATQDQIDRVQRKRAGVRRPG